jgi:NAD(P)-dependent dehydrogenase (short-subunit alcohol dehydrogenase family)
MKILIVGGTGTIGRKASQHFAKKHDTIIAGRSSGDVQVDIADSGSIAAMYEAYFPGHNPIPMSKVINAYVRSVEGKGTGEIIRVYDYQDVAEE